MLDNISHLCFDKDGVIIDVHKYWMHTTKLRVSFLKKRFNLSAEDEILFLTDLGVDLKKEKLKKMGPSGYHPRPVIVEQVITTSSKLGLNLKYNQINKIFSEIDIYQQQKNDYKIELIDGVKEFFELSIDNFTLTIFTSDRKKNALKALADNRIDNFFSYVIGGDNVKFQKPNPEGIYKACDYVNTRPFETAYISDTSSDLDMARSAKVGMKIGVTTGLDDKSQLKNISDITVENLMELI